ncbi:MAG: hypothetical protein ACLU3D_08280 [Acutalibacteraceae bacterium]
MIYLDGFPSWQVGSGSYITLKNRYLYEWRSYTSQFEEDNGHDMKLTRIDCSTGKVEVVDEFQLNPPLIYLCKMDEERFLSYYVVKAPSEKNEYATLTVATIYNLDGTKKEIIREKYENDVDWTDSEGTLIERFAVKDGEIYGFGRRRISGAYKFFSITMIIMENYWKRRRCRALKTSSARNNLWIFCWSAIILFFAPTKA